jgi:hypothetical protein
MTEAVHTDMYKQELPQGNPEQLAPEHRMKQRKQPMPIKQMTLQREFLKLETSFLDLFTLSDKP